jgi:hypothetical protein
MAARVAAKGLAPLSGIRHVCQGIDIKAPLLARPLAARGRSGRT